MIDWLGLYALHSTLLLGGVWLADRLFRSASPALVVGLWRTALVAGLLTASLQTFGLVQPLGEPVIIAGPIVDQFDPGPAGGAILSAPRTEPPLALPWRRIVVGLWLVGATLLCLRSAFAWGAFRRGIGQRTAVTEGDLFRRVHFLAQQGGLRRVRVSVSDRTLCPLALPGTEVCLPRGVEGRFSPAQLDAMIAHEVAHLVRRDVAWLAISRAMGALLFFQPLIFVARRRMVDLSEMAADDWATTRTGGGRELAECLASFAQRLSPGSTDAFAASMAQERAGIVPRVRRLLTGPRSSGVLSPATIGALVLGGLGVAALLPGVSAEARAVISAPPPSLLTPAPTDTGGAAPPAPSASGGARRSAPATAASDPAVEDSLVQLQVARRIRSDSKAAEALRAIDLSKPLPGEAFAAYVEIAADVGSDSEMHAALGPLMASPNTQEAAILRAIQVAGREIGSDSELSNLLSRAAPRVGASQVLAAAYIEASTTIGSDGEQADALVDLARRARLAEGHLERLRALARDMPSRAHRERLLAASTGS